MIKKVIKKLLKDLYLLQEINKCVIKFKKMFKILLQKILENFIIL